MIETQLIKIKQNFGTEIYLPVDIREADLEASTSNSCLIKRDPLI